MNIKQAAKAVSKNVCAKIALNAKHLYAVFQDETQNTGLEQE